MSGPIFTPPRTVAIPSDRAWLDPTLIARNLYTRVSDYVYTGQSPVQVAQLDATRWALGIFLPPTLNGPFVAAPFSDVNINNGWSVTPGAPQWFHLRTHGSLVTGEWWVHTPGDSPIRVVEVLRIV